MNNTTTESYHLPNTAHESIFTFILWCFEPYKYKQYKQSILYIITQNVFQMNQTTTYGELLVYLQTLNKLLTKYKKKIVT